MKKVYVFFADGFEEIEALTVVDVLRRAGVEVVMATVTGSLQVTGAHKVKVVCDCLLDEVDASEAAALVLPGGMPGAQTLADCQPLGRMLLDQNARGGWVAAICAAPMVLGRLGIVQGRKATCYPGFETYLKGAACQGNLVEADGNVVTGKGPGAAMPFALKLAEVLVGADKVEELKQSMIL